VSKVGFGAGDDRFPIRHCDGSYVLLKVEIESRQSGLRGSLVQAEGISLGVELDFKPDGLLKLGPNEGRDLHSFPD
jgi:hypothetical protein